MATPANLLLARTFDGAGYPDFDTVWPGFTFPASGAVNNALYSRPVVDGHGHGIPTRGPGGLTWRALCTANPGGPDYQADLWGRWSSPGTQGRREVGLIVRAKDVDNLLVARIRSMVGASPELRLFKIQGGVATQLGSTYTGAGLSSTTQANGMRWRVRVEDLGPDEGNQTLVSVYLAPTGASGKGTKVLEVQRDLSYLRGHYAVGVELTDQVHGTDVRVDDLEVYDLADEWNPAGPSPAPGAGWQVDLDGTLRTLDELAALEPPVHLVRVKQAYGVKGNQAVFRVDGDHRLWDSSRSVVRPGVAVRVLHDGAVRFRGTVADGALNAGPDESQLWNAWDGYWAARQVILQEDDKSGTHYFNVTDGEADEWLEDRQGMKLGQVFTWLLDRYAPQLRELGAAPANGTTPYVQAEADLLQAEIPDLALSGTLVQAVETLLRLVAHRYQLWWDPEDLVWHLRDVTSTALETLECTAEWLTFKVRPDRDKSHSHVVWMGQRREDDDDLVLSTRDGSLKPVWTQEQESKYGKDKRNKSTLVAKILASGMSTAPDGQLRMYADVKAGLMDTDDFRGAVVSVSGYGFSWFCVNNTGTRVWFSPPYLGGSPPLALGSTLVLNLVSSEAAAHLSAQGVGRGYTLLPPAQICGNAASKDAALGYGFKLRGFCGEARAYTENEDGSLGWEEHYKYHLHVPTRAQMDAGWCEPAAVLSEPPKPSVGLVNFLPPKGSLPELCQPNAPATFKSVHLELRVPRVKDDVPYFRYPAEGHEGCAADKWGCEQPYIVNDPEFTSLDQQPGLELAAADILAVKGGCAFLGEFQLATPWHVTTPEHPTRAATSRFAGLAKRVKVTSTERLPTGGTGMLGDGDAHMLYGVTWEVEANTTKLEAGTAAGWLEASGQDIARTYEQARLLRKVAKAVNQVSEYMRRSLEKLSSQIGGVQKGPVAACDVVTTNEQTKRVVDIKQDDEDKVRGITHGAMRDVLDQALASGPEANHPGNPVQVPGRSGAGTELPLPGHAGLVGQALNPLVPFQGPPPIKGGDLGKYGGPLVTDRAQEGRPPREVMRRAGYVWRKREDGDGNPDGGPGMEVATTDAHGNATGGWVPFFTPKDLPGGGPFNLPAGRVPLSRALGQQSTGHQLLQRSQHLARRLSILQDEVTEALLHPGDTSTGGTVAPADLADNLLAEGMLPFRVVPSSRSDPGGLVWEGPMREGGANAGLFWRVVPRTGVLARVTDVGAGGGANGGSWAYDTSGPGGATEVLLHGELIHKQVHLGADWEMDTTRAAPGSMSGVAEPGHPFGLTAHLRQFNDLAVSGWGFTVDMPSGVRGTPMFYATVQEDPLGGMPPGLTYAFQIDWAYKASPWGAVGAGTAQAGVTTDGGGTGTGQFKQPGGSVPPGLRRVSASVVHTPGGGTAPPTPGVFPNLAGGAVEVARTESGWLLLFSDGAELADLWEASDLAWVDQPVLADAWHVEVEAPWLSHELDLLDTWYLVPNPPLELYETLGMADAWRFNIVELAEPCSIGDTWYLELNP